MGPLRIEHVSKNFGGLRALADVDLELEDGERRVLIGPNGAGKTTLFNIICGQISPSSGRIFIFGKDVTNLPPHKRTRLGLGRTFQMTNLFSNLTVEENVLLSLKAVDSNDRFPLTPLFSYKHLRLRAESLLNQAGLWAKRNVSVCSLSYGEQRQLEVVMALGQNPKLLLLDEFTSGLSPAEIKTMTSVIKSLPKGITLLVIEHDMDVAFELGEFFTVLHMGQLFAEGSLDQIKSNNKVQEIYLGSPQ